MSSSTVAGDTLTHTTDLYVMCPREVGSGGGRGDGEGVPFKRIDRRNVHIPKLSRPESIIRQTPPGNN